MQKTVLIIGASRGLGLAMAEEYLKRDWRVIATARSTSTDGLRRIAETSSGALEVETVDVTLPEEVAGLRARLGDRRLDVLFVNAGVTNDHRETIADVSNEEFVRVMLTNSLSPMRVIEAFQDLVPATGTIGVMSSGQGSLTNNTHGKHELYRGSKAALNMFMRSFVARRGDDARTFLLTAPGWVRTDLGGPDARLSIGESIPSLIDTMQSYEGRSGLHYLDYQGRVVPW